MSTYTREDIYYCLVAIHDACKNSVYGLPLGNDAVMSTLEDILISKLSLTIHEDARILCIQKHTGCTRAQAQSLIDSGDI